VVRDKRGGRAAARGRNSMRGFGRTIDQSILVTVSAWRFADRSHRRASTLMHFRASVYFASTLCAVKSVCRCGDLRSVCETALKDARRINFEGRRLRANSERFARAYFLRVSAGLLARIRFSDAALRGRSSFTAFPEAARRIAEPCKVMSLVVTLSGLRARSGAEAPKVFSLPIWRLGSWRLCRCRNEGGGHFG